MLEGVGPFGLSSQGDGAMPRTTWRASTSKSLHPIFKNRFNQVPSVTEYPLIKRIRTDTTIDLSKILPRRVTYTLGNFCLTLKSVGRSNTPDVDTRVIGCFVEKKSSDHTRCVKQYFVWPLTEIPSSLAGLPLSM